jgi:hypothetical protein
VDETREHPTNTEVTVTQVEVEPNAVYVSLEAFNGSSEEIALAFDEDIFIRLLVGDRRLTYRPPERRRSGLARYVYSDAESRSEAYADIVLDTFRAAIREFEQYMASVVSIRRMVTRTLPEPETGRGVQYDELFQFIRFCLVGENHPVRLPAIPMYLDWLATADHPTTADIACFPYTALSEEGGISRQDYPAIRRWLDRVRRIEGFTVMSGVFPASRAREAS